jgi:hypothetical protein
MREFSGLRLRGPLGRAPPSTSDIVPDGTTFIQGTFSNPAGSLIYKRDRDTRAYRSLQFPGPHGKAKAGCEERGTPKKVSLVEGGKLFGLRIFAPPLRPFDLVVSTSDLHDGPLIGGTEWLRKTANAASTSHVSSTGRAVSR